MASVSVRYSKAAAWLQKMGWEEYVFGPFLLSIFVFVTVFLGCVVAEDGMID